MIFGKKKIVLFIFGLTFLFLSFSCYKEYLEKRDYKIVGKSFVVFKGGKCFLTVNAEKSQNVIYKKKPSISEPERKWTNERDKEIEKNLLKRETVSATLDIVYYEGSKRKLGLEKFLNFNPKFCEGILDSASVELLKGEQNLGKMGLLLPLYRIGCHNPDWAVLDLEQNKLYSLESEEIPRRPLKLPVYAEGGGIMYKGERNFAIASPSFNVSATLSKKGKLILLDEKGKKLFERNNIYNFCFHPKKKILYFVSEEGLIGYNWEKKMVFVLRKSVLRLIRISASGRYLFAIKTGGENMPVLFKISNSGKKIEREIPLDDDIKKADDWVFAGNSVLLAIFNSENGALMKELDLRIGEKKVVESPEGSEIYLINSATYPTIIAKANKKESYEEKVYYYDIDLKKFEIVLFTNS